MSDLKRIVSLPLNQKEILALANCAGVGFSLLVTGDVGPGPLLGAAKSLKALSHEEWNALQERMMTLIQAAFPEVRTTHMLLRQDDERE